MINPKILAFVALSFLVASSLGAKPDPSDSAPLTFVSIPDFLNFDIEYPQKGWEDALGFIVNSMKKEDPVFMVLSESAATAAAQAISFQWVCTMTTSPCGHRVSVGIQEQRSPSWQRLFCRQRGGDQQQGEA